MAHLVWVDLKSGDMIMQKFFTIILLALFFWNCSKKNDDTLKGKYSDEQAKLVSELTSGVINPSDKITIRFTTPRAEAENINQNIEPSAFHFEPEIKGKSFWQDKQTLVFQPATPLTQRQRYSGYVDLKQALFAEKNLEAERIDFEFVAAGREIILHNSEFKLEKENDPALVRLSGEIKFNQNVSLDELKKSVTVVSKDGGELNLSWQATDSLNFKYSSELIKRDTRSHIFEIRISKKELDISNDWFDELELPSIKEMAATAITPVLRGEEYALKIEFSDELNGSKNYNGFVTTKPALNLKTAANGKALYIEGAFQAGLDYEITVLSGVSGKWGNLLNQAFQSNLKLPDFKPQMSFLQTGSILPSANKNTIRFKTVNVKNVKVVLKKVYENNIGYFLQESTLDGSKSRSEPYWNISRVGVEVYNKQLNLTNQKNSWLTTELDLDNLFKKDSRGLYILELNFEQNDMIYNPEDYSADDYYNNPAEWGYLYQYGTRVKPLLISDLALTAKSTSEGIIIFANDILTTKPLAGTKVNLISYQNQLLESGVTDSDGKFQFKTADGFYVEGEYKNQKSLLKFNDNRWNESLFDVGGVKVEQGGLKSFIFSERGVYRPGDEINLSIILRNKSGSFPDRNPVLLCFYNPRGQLVSKTVNNLGKDGFYSFKLKTKPEDLTGDWRADFEAGGALFSQNVKVETVVPYKLKVAVTASEKNLTPATSQLNLSVKSQYLFGLPSADHECMVSATLFGVEKKFSRFKNYLFNHEGERFEAVSADLYNGRLNSAGESYFSWELPEIKNAPASLSAVITARVLEKGGRPVINRLILDYDKFNHYVGIEKLEDTYLKTGTPAPFKVVAVDKKGNPVVGRNLKYRIYRNNYYWWYHYNDQDDFIKNFKTDYETVLVAEGSVVSSYDPVTIEYTPDNYGELLLEVSDGSQGHTAGIFCRAYAWGSESVSRDAATLRLKSAKPAYEPGENAKILVNTPKSGSLLVSVEKGGRVLYSKWQTLTSEQTELSIPITAEMVPNVYISLMAIQPHEQSTNDRPLRLYGILPLTVIKKDARLTTEMVVKNELRPGESFQITLKTKDKSVSQFVLAVVDEGLLDLTAFKTPDPLKFFFNKEMLSVLTYDIFNNIIGKNFGKIQKRFSIGGDYAELADRQKNMVKANRFKAVSIFQGPVSTNANGEAVFKVTIPDYIGSVRIMAVGVSKDRYIALEKSVPVKAELMVQTALPRVLGPGDEIDLPVTVFGLKDNLNDTKISIETAGPVQILGGKEKVVSFKTKGEKTVNFRLRAADAIGAATIKVKASAQQFKAETSDQIAVRPSAPYLTKADDKTVSAGQKADFTIPTGGVIGTTSAKFMVSKLPILKLESRLRWLIQYPYGCVEQTTSAAFPQIYLKELFNFPKNETDKIDQNINAAIRRLRGFQIRNGGFSYWPGAQQADLWGSNYAGHFLLAAKNNGYAIPDDMLNRWISFETTQALSHQGSMLDRCYRLYLLALAQKPQIGPMNFIRESAFSTLDNPSKILLAAAYKLAGAADVAQTIFLSAKTTVRVYEESNGTYGSDLRDKALMLHCAILLEGTAKAGSLYKEVLNELTSNNWYSTQTTAFGLMASAQFVKKFGKADKLIKGQLVLANGKSIEINENKDTYSFDLKNNFGQAVKFINKSGFPLFTSLVWEGVPLKDESPSLQSNLNLSVNWLDENGNPLNIEQLNQGKVFWCHLKVTRNTGYEIPNLALVQILPAGWEVENTRLSGEELPEWARSFNLNRADYLDIRDDRVMWFYNSDYDRRSCDFLIKLNAVTKGSFYLPPTLVEAMYKKDHQGRIAGKEVIVK